MDDRTATEMIALLPRLQRFALALTGVPADAEDLTQMTCERAIAQIGLWQPGTRLDSWMYRIAQNLHRNRLRHDRVRATHLRDVSGEAPASVPAQGIDRLTLGEIGALVARLPSEQRAALLLVSVEGCSYAEAAAILDVTPGTIASRVSRARRFLADEFQGDRGNAEIFG